MIPVFIHINSCGGRYLRKKLCEKYNNKFYIHHINPKAWNNSNRDKIVRFWRYRNPDLIYNHDILKCNKNTVLNLQISNDKYIFCILRHPYTRYISENKNIDCMKYKKSHNI